VGEISKQQLAVYAAAAIAIALIGARYVRETGNPSTSGSAGRPAARLQVSGTRANVFVHVTGAVRRPGVYRLPAWARLDLAVRRAGGPARGADLDGVNLAAKVADGQQVIVPVRGAAEGSAAAATPGAGESSAGPVSLNTATLAQLDELEGVGPVTAQKILDWRKQHGGFRSIDDLKQISGIGPKRFDSLKDKVRM
jgi:competence protein ComEA